MEAVGGDRGRQLVEEFLAGRRAEDRVGVLVEQQRPGHTADHVPTGVLPVRHEPGGELGAGGLDVPVQQGTHGDLVEGLGIEQREGDQGVVAGDLGDES